MSDKGPPPAPAGNGGDDALARLQAAKAKMEAARDALSDDAIAALPADQRGAALDKRRQATTAILEIENTEIATVTARLAENEAALTRATDDLGAALDRLEDVQRVLTAIGGLFSVLTRILPLPI